MSKPEDMPGHILWFLLCPNATKQGGQTAALLQSVEKVRLELGFF